MRRLAAVTMAVIVASLFPTAQAHSEDIGCSWLFKAEADTVNVAFPDDSANYWVTRFTFVPGARLIVRGRYPAARYFSLHAYDEATRPVGSLADVEIAPDAGSVNPFVDPTASHGGAYTAYVELTPPPADPAPNTMYAGELYMNGTTAQNPAGFLIYRVYVSADPSDIRGAVGLPQVSLELPDGSEVPFGSCEDTPPPSSGAPLTQAIAESSFPDAVPRVVPYPAAQDRFEVFYGLVGDRGGFYSNRHVSYMTRRVSRQSGDVFVFRAQAPTFPDTRAGEDVTAGDLRYWSVCSTELATQRYVDCAADHQTTLDAGGYMTFVISDPADRPSNATAENGITWLPWGGTYYDNIVIYRHMLPAPSFDQAIQNVAPDEDPATVMGAFYPVSTFCTPDAFASGGASAADAFAACMN